jgi:hypothetical protein
MLSWLWMSAFLACGGQVLEDYEREKQKVLTPAPPIKGQWQPDIRLRISYLSLDKMGKKLLQDSIGKGQFKKKAMGITFSVKLSNNIENFKLKDGGEGGKLGFQSKAIGTARWKVGALKSALPYSATIKGTAEIVEKDGTTHLQLVSIESLKLGTSKTPAIDVGPALETWMQEAVAQTPHIELGHVDLEKFGLRAMRVSSEEKTADISLLSDVPDASPLPPVFKEIGSDWELMASEDCVAMWMRRAAYRQGIISHGVAVDPQSFTMSDQDFSMGLRLWRLEGLGKWWREYEVSGITKVDKHRIKMDASDVEEGGKSPWAGAANPLILLGEGLIMEALEEQISYVLPAKRATRIGDKKLKAKVEKIYGRQGSVVVQGKLLMATTQQ